MADSKPFYKMSEEEKVVKDWLIYDVLAGKGFKTFAQHLINYDVFLTNDPSKAAYMMPSRGCIVINRYFDDEDLISVLIRHELLHYLLNHERYAIADLAEKQGLDPHHLKKSDYNNLKQEVYNRQVIPGLEHYGPVSYTNVAGDWDLSRYYSKKDMDKIKKGEFLGTPLGGLVLELDHPEWLNLSYTEIINELKDIEKAARRAALSELSGTYLDEDHFVVDTAAEDLGIDSKKLDDEPKISNNDVKNALEYELRKHSKWSDEFEKTKDDTFTFGIKDWGKWSDDFFDTSTLLDISENILTKIINKIKSQFKFSFINFEESDEKWIEIHWSLEK